MRRIQHASALSINHDYENDMLKLRSQAQDLYWLDLLPDVRVRVRPATVAAIIVARNEAAKVFRSAAPPAAEPPAAEPLPTEAADQLTGAEAAAGLVSALAHFAITEWEGIGDEADAPAPVTPENIDKLLAVWPVYRAFDEKYVSPALAGQEEKNGSATPPAGTSKAGKSTAAPAA